MSRRSRSDFLGGRDPLVFAANVTLRRKEMSLSMKALAREAGIGYNTLIRIESGEGCTPSVELKLALALGTQAGRLWERRVPELQSISYAGTGRWFFGDLKDAQRYLEDHQLLELGETLRKDPDAIQDENERARLGAAGLTIGFYRSTDAHLVSGDVRSAYFEVYRPTYLLIPVGIFSYFYCLQGPMQMVNGEATFTLNEGDCATLEGQSPCYVQPGEFLKSKKQPCKFIIVEVDPFRITPPPERRYVPPT